MILSGMVIIELVISVLAQIIPIIRTEQNNGGYPITAAG